MTEDNRMLDAESVQIMYFSDNYGCIISRDGLKSLQSEMELQDCLHCFGSPCDLICPECSSGMCFKCFTLKGRLCKCVMLSH